MTNGLKEYKVAFVGLKLGKHEYDFELNSAFLSHFPESLVNKCEAVAHLTLDKIRENFMELDLEVKGSLEVGCDRCLDEFTYPFEYGEKIFVKVGVENTSVSDDIELIELPKDAFELDLSVILYEFLNVSLPLRQLCEVVQKECNPEVTSYIAGVIELDELEEETEVAPDKPMPWDALEVLKKKLEQEENGQAKDEE